MINSSISNSMDGMWNPDIFLHIQPCSLTTHNTPIDALRLARDQGAIRKKSLCMQGNVFGSSSPIDTHFLLLVFHTLWEFFFKKTEDEKGLLNVHVETGCCYYLQWIVWWFVWDWFKFPVTKVLWTSCKWQLFKYCHIAPILMLTQCNLILSLASEKI